MGLHMLVRLKCPGLNLPRKLPGFIGCDCIVERCPVPFMLWPGIDLLDRLNDCLPLRLSLLLRNNLSPWCFGETKSSFRPHASMLTSLG
jgi:hypothetical protein